MEVRIKDNQGYVDADWTIEDGIMVVSPKKEVKWKPDLGEEFFFPIYESSRTFCVDNHTHIVKESLDNDLDIRKGWCFKTEEECQAFCDKLNQAISEVKP